VNLVDSSGWLEFFADGKNADFFATPIEETTSLIVSTINLYEVFKRIYQQRGEDQALKAMALMMQGQIIEVTSSISLEAAKFSADHKLPMADALIYITSASKKAALWTQDSDLKPFKGVQYIQK
jgi:predicted nucleic acid-binding protein